MRHSSRPAPVRPPDTSNGSALAERDPAAQRSCERRSGQLSGASGALLDRQSPEDLFARFHLNRDDLAVREALVRRFLPLAHKVARRYARSSEPYDDLVQVASLGLVKAIERFEPGRGSAFASFAIPTISGELKRYFRDAGWSVHVPRGTQERAMAIERAVGELTESRGRTPSVQELAAHLLLSCEQVLEGLQAARAYEALSLDAPRSSESEDDDVSTVGSTLGAVDDGYELVDHETVLAGALRHLPERERQILRLRYFGDKTQSEIAAALGVSQMQVSRLLRRSIQRLRELSGEEPGERSREAGAPRGAPASDDLRDPLDALAAGRTFDRASGAQRPPAARSAGRS